MVGPHEIVLGGLVQFGRIDAIECGEHRRAGGLFALVGDGDRRLDEAARILHGERFVLPGLDGLVFERHAGGVADEAVGAGELRQCGCHRGGRIIGLAVESLQGMPGRTLGSTARLAMIAGRRRFAALVDDAIQLALATAAADGEVEGAVLTHGEVGERERSPRQELLLHPLVGRTLWLQVDRVHRPERPVADVEGFLVFGGELRAVAEGRTHGRPGADVDERRQAVRERVGPLATARTPAELAATGGMIDAGRSVPRRSKIPLHVGVVDEQFTIGVERHVVGVAVAGRPDFPGLPVGVGAHHVAAGGEHAGGVAVGVPHASDDLILVPVGRQPAGAVLGQFHAALIGPHAPHGLRFGDVFDGERHLRVVAADDHELLAVGREQDVVRTVLAAALEAAQRLDRIGHAVAVGVGDAIQAAARATVADDVQRVEGPEQSLGAGDRRGHLLHDRGPGAVERCGSDPRQAAAALIAGVETALGIAGQADPRPELVLGHDEQPFHGEAVGHVERRSGPQLGRSPRQHLAPRAFARLGHDLNGRRGLRGGGIGGVPRGVALDDRHAAVGAGEDQPAGEAAGPPVVGHHRRQFIVALLEVLGDIDRDGTLPFRARADLSAVDEERHAVVAAGHEHRLAGPAREHLGQTVGAVQVRPPDPRGRGGRGGGGRRFLDRIRGHGRHLFHGVFPARRGVDGRARQAGDENQLGQGGVAGGGCVPAGHG